MSTQTLRLAASLLVALPVFFSACVKDTCKGTRTYTYYQPIYSTKEDVRKNIKSSPAKALQNPGKICIRGNYIFLNEVDQGIHVIDNTDPSRPKNIAFIAIPGNMDIAVKGDYLYADLYTDMVTLDISNPSNVVLKKAIENIFPERYYSNGFLAASGNNVIVRWDKRDTTVTESCDAPRWRFDMLTSNGAFFAAASSTAGGSNVSASPIGIGGSMARFTIVNERLYAVNNQNLNVFNISNLASPTQGNKINIGWNIETIYPFKNKLFVGSQNGMYIYNITNPDLPVAAGQFSHVRSCDPVIADDNYAYVTLRSGNACQGFTNQLDIVKLNNITDPVLQKTYQLTNPHGLSKDGDLLFICDGAAGVKLYNAANIMDLKLLQTISGLDTYDVIAMNKVALVVAKSGLYQYSYNDPSNPQLISSITFDK